MSEWIDVKEKLPNKSGTYLTWNGGRIGWRCSAFSKTRGKFWQSVTHWTVLPEPPVQAGFRECGVCQKCGVALQYDNYLLNAFGQTMISHLLDNGTRDIRCTDGALHYPEDGWFEKYVTQRSESVTNPNES